MSVNKKINNNLLVISKYMDELELDNCRLRNSDEILNNVIEEKDKEIDRLNNIIKEVREYIDKEHKLLNLDKSGYTYTKMGSDILEILDKGE